MLVAQQDVMMSLTSFVNGIRITIYNYIITIYTCTCTCIALREVLTSVLQESQRLTTYDFVMLPLATISLHMLTFQVDWLQWLLIFAH